MEKEAEADPTKTELQHQLALSYMDEDDDGNMISLDKAIYWFKKAAENGDAMCDSQYRLWSYVKKLMADGVLPEGTYIGEYMDYIMMNGLLEEAENYEP